MKTYEKRATGQDQCCIAQLAKMSIDPKFVVLTAINY